MAVGSELHFGTPSRFASLRREAASPASPGAADAPATALARAARTARDAFLAAGACVCPPDGAGPPVISGESSHAMKCLCAGIAKRGGRLVIGDLRTHAVGAHDASLRRARHRSFLCVPVVDASGAVIGAIGVADREQRAWSGREVAALEGIAAMLGAELGHLGAATGAGNASNLGRARLAKVSHDLRTPLTSVVGIAGMLADPRFDFDEQAFRSQASTIGEAAQRMREIVDTLTERRSAPHPRTAG